MSISVASMEHLGSLGIGESITVGDETSGYKVWERREDGWRSGRFIIDTSSFAGEVAKNRITAGVRPQEGQVWAVEGDAHYLLVEMISETREWWTVRIRDGRFVNARKFRSVPGSHVSERPDWYHSINSIARHYVRAVAQREEADARALNAERDLSRRRRDGNIELSEYRDRLQSSLHEFMRASDFGPDHPLNELMAEHSMRRLPQMIDVTVNVTGRAYESLGVGVLQPFVSNATVMRNSDVTIHWEKTVTVSVEVESGVCGCGLVAYSAVAAELRKEDLPPDYFTYGMTCPND